MDELEAHKNSHGFKLYWALTYFSFVVTGCASVSPFPFLKLQVLQ